MADPLDALLCGWDPARPAATTAPQSADRSLLERFPEDPTLAELLDPEPAVPDPPAGLPVLPPAPPERHATPAIPQSDEPLAAQRSRLLTRARDGRPRPRLRLLLPRSRRARAIVFGAACLTATAAVSQRHPPGAATTGALTASAPAAVVAPPAYTPKQRRRRAHPHPSHRRRKPQPRPRRHGPPRTATPVRRRHRRPARPPASVAPTPPRAASTPRSPPSPAAVAASEFDIHD